MSKDVEYCIINRLPTLELVYNHFMYHKYQYAWQCYELSMDINPMLKQLNLSLILLCASNANLAKSRKISCLHVVSSFDL